MENPAILAQFKIQSADRRVTTQELAEYLAKITERILHGPLGADHVNDLNLKGHTKLTISFDMTYEHVPPDSLETPSIQS